MKTIEDFLNESPSKEWHLKAIKDFSDEQKDALLDLAHRLEAAGARHPLQWAVSEVAEGIPQFGRFLVLKKLTGVSNATQDNLDMAADFSEDISDTFAEITEAIGKDRAHEFLAAFSRGLVYNLLDLVDEGNVNADRDKISWSLMQTDEQLENTGKIIQGLHEDFMEFDEET